jgi:iron(III) transport system substrate-binding protein
MTLTRRHALAGAAAISGAGTSAAQAQSYDPPGSLIDAARKEGRVVLYTASFTDVEQETAAAFNKRFPFVKIEIIRASGGQLITRVRTEASAGKLIADVIDHSDRALMKAIEDIFLDYAPPNAADYLPTARISERLWPRITTVWCLAYNPELTKTPPRTWMDLTRTDLYGPGAVGEVVAPSGGTTWTRAMFERQVLGEDYWAKQAATKPALFPSNAPATDAVIRGEVMVAPVVRNAVFPKLKDGAPVELVFPPEGIPIVPYATGIPKVSQRPNAAKLFLDWCLSAEGQAWTMREQGNMTALAKLPVALPGFDPKVHKLWLPEPKAFETLHDSWCDEWSKIYGYRQ